MKDDILQERVIALERRLLDTILTWLRQEVENNDTSGGGVYYCIGVALSIAIARWAALASDPSAVIDALFSGDEVKRLAEEIRAEGREEGEA